MRTMDIALPRDKRGQNLVQLDTRARKLQVWPAAAKRPPVELVVREPLQEAHPFHFVVLVMMEPVLVRQKIVRMCPRLLGGFCDSRRAILRRIAEKNGDADQMPQQLR